jgi:large subunit ribosomal protein L32e
MMMSKKAALTDVPGVGPAMEAKLRESGIKTVLALSKATPEKLAQKIDGLSEAGAGKIISAAKSLLPEEPKKGTEKTEKKAKEPALTPKVKEAKPKTESKKAEAKAEAPKTTKATEKKKPPKQKPVSETKKKEPALEAKTIAKPAKGRETKASKARKDAEVTEKSGPAIDQRLFRLAVAKKKRKPKFNHEQAHRWVRVSDSWRKVRGIDSTTRVRRKGRAALVSPGYRSPKGTRGLHPSGYIEALVRKPSDLESLDPDVHAVRIAASVGLRKRQVILDRAESDMFRILNPSIPESVGEEELFEELEGLDDMEVD